MIKKYYKNAFFNLIDLPVWNAYILYSKNKGTRCYLECRNDLVDKLIEKYHSQKMEKRCRLGTEPNPLRLKERFGNDPTI